MGREGADPGTDGATGDGGGELTGPLKVADEDRDLVLATKGNAGGIHDLEIFLENVKVGEVGEEASVGIFAGIVIEDAFDLGGFDQELGVDLLGAESGGGIRGDEGVSGTSGEDHDAAGTEVFAKGLGVEARNKAGERKGGVEGAGGIVGEEEGTQGEAIHHGGEHPDGIGLGAFEPIVFAFGTPEEVSAAYDDRDLNALESEGFDLVGEGKKDLAVIRGGMPSPETFTAEFEKDALVARGGRHRRTTPRAWRAARGRAKAAVAPSRLRVLAGGCGTSLALGAALLGTPCGWISCAAFSVAALGVAELRSA